MTTKQIATQILSIAIENDGYRVSTRWIAGHLNLSAEQISEALDLLGKKIIRVRGVGAFIQAA